MRFRDCDSSAMCSDARPGMTIFGREQVSLLGFTFTAHLLAVGGLMLLVAGYSAGR